VNAHEAYLALIRVLAVRTAELHRALARPTTDPAFAPQPLTRADIDAYRQRATDEVRNALDMLASGMGARAGGRIALGPARRSRSAISYWHASTPWRVKHRRA